MNYFTILLLLLFAALALVQTYRLRDATASAKHYKNQAEAGQYRENTWRNYGHTLWNNYAKARDYMPVLEPFAKLTPKRLRRIINAYYKRQYVNGIGIQDVMQMSPRRRAAYTMEMCSKPGQRNRRLRVHQKNRVKYILRAIELQPLP